MPRIKLDNHVDLVAGDPISKVPAALIMEMQTIHEDIDVVDGHIDRQPGLNGHGWQIHTGSAGQNMQKPFDLENLEATNFAISVSQTESGAVWMVGTLKDTIAIGGDTGDPKLRRDTGDTITDSFWSSDTLSGKTKQAVWLELERGDTAGDTTNIVEIWTDSSFPLGAFSDTKYARVEIVPLYYFPFDTTNATIDFANMYDMRGAIRLPGMA